MLDTEVSANLLSQHLRKSHALAPFACSTCHSRFRQMKDLKRHQVTHEPLKRIFACSCTKAYARYDGLLRHFTEMSKRQQEAGRHRTIEPSPEKTDQVEPPEKGHNLVNSNINGT